MTKQIVSFLMILLILAGASTQTRPSHNQTPERIQHHTQRQPEADAMVYLPLVLTAGCTSVSSNVYTSGAATQFDKDDPVRPTNDHADKNIDLRGYVANTSSGLQQELIDYGSDDPTQPPQFATLFDPNQVPPISGYYQVHQWAFATSPTAGTRAEAIAVPKVTGISFSLAAKTPLHVPSSGYDIGGGMEVLVIYADADTVSLHYTREDSAATGYTVILDKICTDPNLLSLYESLDSSSGARYDFPSAGYDLPNLTAGQMVGTTGSEDMVLIINDTGSFQDPRSCNEWWQIKPGYTGTCPTATN